MDLWQSLNGLVCATVTSADTNRILSVVRTRNITLDQIVRIDEITVRFVVKRQDFDVLKKLLDERGDHIEITDRIGLFWRLKAFLKRPLLIFGILLLLISGTFIPTRIYFFRVEGNANIPTQLILEVASESGLHFGASRRQVRSERVKNQLLESIPQLQWAGINTSGCVATISVRERQQDATTTQKDGVSSIVADRDGIIHEITVTNGSAACKIGDSVTKGQTLISGYTDCGLSIRAERARGEIYAATSHKSCFVMPSNWEIRGQKLAEVKKYSIIIGKKRINFYKDSGILDSSCVKMYSENYLTLPGGFQLPVAIITETWVSYSSDTSIAALDKNQELMVHLAEKYLQSRMIAGQILAREEDFSSGEDVLLLQGTYNCLEMIGRERYEEIIAP